MQHTLAEVTMFLASMTVLFASAIAIQDPVTPSSLFYPFGSDEGHHSISESLTEVCLEQYSIPFGSAYHVHVGISKTGVLSLAWEHHWHLPSLWGSHYPRIIPFWCDVVHDNRTDLGRIYYGATTKESVLRPSWTSLRLPRSEELLRRATHDVRKSFLSTTSDFQAQLLVIVTWHRVTYTGGDQHSPRNSFQAVLISNERQSFVMFNYGSMNYFSPAKSFPMVLPTFEPRCFSGFYYRPNQESSSTTSTGFQKAIYPTRALRSCRRIFRVDDQIIESGSTCRVDNVCESYQFFDDKTKKCVDIGPVYDSPKLEGPVVIDRLWVVFYCDAITNETRKDASYNVTFLFDGKQDARMSSFILHPPHLRATLHEIYLSKNLGKWVSCQVSSSWKTGKNLAQTQPLSSNDYWLGIEVYPKTVYVYEGSAAPVLLTIRATIPITCGQGHGLSEEDDCLLTLAIASSSDKVLVRKKDSGGCRHVMRDSDWKDRDKETSRRGDEIELFAKIDPFVSGPSSHDLIISIGPLAKKKTPEGEQYSNIWHKHEVAKIQVFHQDAPQGVCRSTGDPHVTTFDRKYYTIYSSGQFTYVQTTRGNPIEVQVRHKPCSNRQRVACVCGVAMRENDVILVADRCGGDSRIHFITYNDDPKGAEIKQSAGGRSFELILPSKVKALANINFYGLTLEIHVTSSEFGRVEGLCGSFDRNNLNDLTVKGQRRLAQSIDEAVESWRVPLGRSLFDGVSSKLSFFPSDIDDRKHCRCSGDVPQCSTSKADHIPSAGIVNNIVTPKKRYARNTFDRRRRSALDNTTTPITDDLDYEYDSSIFKFEEQIPSPNLENGTWPAGNNITEEQAKDHCRKTLWDDLPVKSSCESFINITDVDAIIDKCITDIKLTDDLIWAEDKVSEVQNLCVFEAITTDTRETNATIEEIVNDVKQMTAIICLPQDCSGHGSCHNGTCVCQQGYVGSDCGLSEDEAPVIVRKIGPSDCDLQRNLCRKVEMLTRNVADSQNLSCKVQIRKDDDSETREFPTSGLFETSQTASCVLPTDEFIGKLRLLQGQEKQSDETETGLEFEYLPLGSPVLHYTVSISNNRVQFSNILPFVTFDSNCFNCSKGLCTRKARTCLIRGYCFTENQANPLNPDCERCEPLISTEWWTKIPGRVAFCKPCSSSPCPSGTICHARSKGRYACQDDTRIVVVASSVTVVAVLMTVVAVFLFILWPTLKRR